MNPLLLGSLFDFGGKLLDRFFPDAEKRREAEAEFLRFAAEAEFKQTLAQLEINAREAQHQSIFVAGWRPFFGWCGGVAFLYSTLVQPMLVWYGAARGWPVPPDINMDLLWVVITGMLGIGGLRTFEKSKGVTK